MEPSEKCPKIDCIDRISSMSDPILGEILSYLSLKEVVATSILSTRWKNLFPNVFTHVKLELEEFMWPRKNLSLSFVNFVDKLFNETLLNVPCVERITIGCDKEYGDDKIVSWARAALRLNVVYFKLDANIVDTEPLFDCLNGCKTLEELKFGTEYDLVLPEDEFELPNLKRLYLYTLSPREDSIHDLLDGCPLLEELSFSGCDLGALNVLGIRSSTLKRLFFDGNFDESGIKVKIDAPNLEAFVYEGRFVANYVVGTLKSLHSASIKFDLFSDEDCENSNVSSDDDVADPFASSVNHLVKLIRACARAARLSLSGNYMAALHSAHNASVKLPRFGNLTCLSLGRMGSHGFQMLALILKNAPNLQTLTFEEGFKKCKGGYPIFESSLPRIPACLKCFKKLVIWKYKGTVDETKFIEYFLKNGRALQEVIIYYVPTHVDTIVLNGLLLLPKRSQTCQILTRVSDNESSARYSRYSRDNWFKPTAC